MTIITVSNTAGLTAALKSAQGGDTIQLAAGTYSGLNFKTAPTFNTAVTITSADPLHQAVITDFSLTGAKGLIFTDLELATLNHADAATNEALGAFKINSSSDIHFDHVSVHGSLDGNAANDIQGIQIRDSQNVSVTNSEFQQLGRALTVGQTSNVVVSGNNVHDLRSDGFDFAQVANVKISGNHFANFTPVGADHPDAIQFWTTGTTSASHDIQISDNVIEKGTGADYQGILMGDNSGVMPYQHVTISDNLIVGTGYNGIRIGGAQDLTLTGNDLVTFAGGNKTWLLVQKADNVTATGNSGTSISFDTSTHVTQTGNTITTAVADHGAAAFQAWIAAVHPDAVDMTDIVANSISLAQVGATADSMIHDALTLAVTNDSLVGDSKANLLQGFGGNDTLNGTGGADTLVGGAGNDTYIVPNSGALIVENPDEGVDTVIATGAHTLEANVENLIINPTDGRGWSGTGNALDNHLTGNAGANSLDGAAGNDTLDGGAGNDTLVGGVGNDWLTGGDGADTFRFAPGSGQDVITDFGAGTDKDTLDISAFLKAGLTPTVTEVSGHAVVSFTDGDSIALMGVHANELGAWSKIGWVF